jgi:hypothetical protein
VKSTCPYSVKFVNENENITKIVEETNKKNENTHNRERQDTIIKNQNREMKRNTYENRKETKLIYKAVNDNDNRI